MMATNMEKAMSCLIIEIPIRVPISEISSKDKATISGKIQPLIKEHLFKGPNMDLDY